MPPPTSLFLLPSTPRRAQRKRGGRGSKQEKKHEKKRYTKKEQFHPLRRKSLLLLGLHFLFLILFFFFFSFGKERGSMSRLCSRPGGVEVAFQTILPPPPRQLAGRGGEIILAHGLLGSGRSWQTAARRLLQHPTLSSILHAAHAIDFRNHGSSPHHLSHANAAIASDLERFLLRPQGEETKGKRGVLIGHSMGGYAVMGMLLRRCNAEAIWRDREGDLGGWGASQREICAREMRAVNEACGFAPEDPLRGVLFDEKKTTTRGRLAACVVVDITPTTPLSTAPGADQGVFKILQAMTRVELGAIRSYDDAQHELQRVGIEEKSMRDFITTNIVLNRGENGGAASWRCNLSTLVSCYEEISPDIVRWFDPNAMNGIAPKPCTLPMLFVFGEKSQFNDPEQRRQLKRFFPNVREVVVEGAGHFVHYEKMDAFVEATAPFIAEHLKD
ncbi:unnamed protein product [Phytomonas sp. EM1]|nr:unnamed protein product [Phytomonas sp. EM1]|eukprot:CCW61835.1 unnamed protein product [Phytomonas sp. isolate EM1]